ncbi:MAG: N-acetyltransferase [Chloroflexi bacterium]|nr:N-acetyltransferase [Chloroflexota bacterium]
MSLRIVPLSQEQELEPLLWGDEISSSWPEFMLKDPIAKFYYDDPRLERYYDFILVAYDDSEPEKILARSFSVPFCFGEKVDREELPDGGWDSVICWADEDYLLKRKPNAVSALEINISPSARGQGLSGKMLQAMRENVKRLGFADLFAPIRPNQKHLEPNTPIEEFIYRVREDGLPVDAWLRVHLRAGGEIVKIAPYSMVIANTLESWREWTDLPFNESGLCIVPYALVPVHISVEQNYAVYVEPNIWIQHKISDTVA